MSAQLAVDRLAGPQPTESPVVAVERLSIGYRTREGDIVSVLRDVTLRMMPGERIGVVGESGCGKSTLALALLGHLRPGGIVVDGRVLVNGHDLFAIEAESRRRLRGGVVALIPQNAGQNLTPTQRVGRQIADVVALHTDRQGADARAQAVELLTAVRLPDPGKIALRYPHELSGGQLQRVAIAMALAGEPSVLVLDEPTTGLDVTTQAAVLSLLDEIRDRFRVAMVYVSHDLGVIARMADRVVVMYAGEIVEDARADLLFDNPLHPYSAGLLAAVPRLSHRGLPPALVGHAPRPGAVPIGCAFAPRCALAQETCRAAPVPLGSTVEVQASLPAAEPPRSVRCVRWLDIGRIAARRPHDGDGRMLAGEVNLAVGTIGDAQQPARADGALLVVDDLEFSYHRAQLWEQIAPRVSRRSRNVAPTISKVNLSVAVGETVALVGESGSGKSTIVRAIAGLLPIEHGDFRLQDELLDPDIKRRPLAQRKAIQIVFQNPDVSLNPRHTVAQLLDRPLALFTGLGRRQRLERAAALLDEVRLDPVYLGRFPGQLSGGEKQRVAIARAFAADPRVVLCDEVVSALDVSVQAAVLGLLTRLQTERGVSYIFVSHDLAVVRAIADRVAVLYAGRLCEFGPVDRVYAPPFHPYTAALLSAVQEPDPTASRPQWGGAWHAPTPTDSSCPFAQRCPSAISGVCDQSPPPWRLFDGGHRIRCHLSTDELRRLDLPGRDAANRDASLGADRLSMSGIGPEAS